MRKILGIAAVILLCSAIASAGERSTVANAGPPSSEVSSGKVVIGEQVDGLATADGSDLIVTVLTGDIGVIFNQTAFIHTKNDNAVTTAGDIGLWFDRVANFKRPVEFTEVAISIVWNPASYAFFMENTGVNSLSEGEITIIGLLKGPRAVAFIHSERQMADA